MGSLATSGAYLALRKTYSSVEMFMVDAVNVINNILQGKLNNTGTLTLTDNSATTTLSDFRIGANSVICLMPTTANAAAELATLYFTTFADGSCTVNHANNAQTDRIYRYTVTG